MYFLAYWLLSPFLALNDYNSQFLCRENRQEVALLEQRCVNREATAFSGLLLQELE